MQIKLRHIANLTDNTTNLRLDRECTWLKLCVCTYGSYHHGSNHH